MSILIIGSEGSMGKRYQAILKYLNRDVICVDKDCPEECLLGYAFRSSGIIIATPTDTHTEIIRKMIPFKKPLLCEKPVTKDIRELRDLKFELKADQVPFRMMYQYQKLDDPGARGVSFYDYFRHGNDGLIWDCLQIIGLARGDVNLADESPIWDCSLNGQPLMVASMDVAYVSSVKDWFLNPHQDFDEVTEAHVKTHELVKSGRFGRG